MPLDRLAFVSATLTPSTDSIVTGGTVTLTATVIGEPGDVQTYTVVYLQQKVAGTFQDTNLSGPIDANGKISWAITIEGAVNEVFQYRCRVENPSYSAIVSNTITITVITPPTPEPTTEEPVPCVGCGIITLWPTLLLVGGGVVAAYFLLKKV